MYAWRPFVALVWLQFRLLRQNRSGCLVLLMLVAAGVSLGRQPADQVNPVCYVVYWQEDAWVRHLRSSLSVEDDLKVEVAPARQFTNENGLIVYPAGCHSIQLRPPNVARQPWRVWYWYSGDDPSVLQPAIEWFWRTSREHFQQALPFEVLVSTLEPPHPTTKSARLHARKLLHFRQAKPALLTICLFFCGAYLPILFLAEQSSSPVLDTLITKPIGVSGWGRSVVLFHGLVTLAVVVPVVVAFQWNTLGIWAAIFLGFGCYQGMAFVIGCGCRSLPSASSALVVYGVFGGIAIVVAFWQGVSPATFSLEARLFELFASESFPVRSLSALALWAAFWVSTGWLMFRRVRVCGAR